MRCFVSFLSVLFVLFIMAVIAIVILNTTTGGCPSTSFRCDENNECLSMEKLCDKIKDCPNGSDEFVLRCADLQGLREHFVDTIMITYPNATTMEPPTTPPTGNCEVKHPEQCTCTSKGIDIVCEDTGFEYIQWDLFDNNAVKIFMNNTLLGDWKEIGDVPKFTELKVLLIEDHAYLKHLPRNFFREAPILSKLFLGNNAVEVIESKVFENMNSLQLLYLSGNSIHTIERSAFYGLSGLQELFLSHNKICLERAFQFQWMPSLKNLYLDRNNLELIGDRLFRDLPELKLINIAANLITEIHPRAFRYNLLLRNLNFESNRIHALDKDLLKGLSELLTLSIGQNPIDFIPAELFRSTPNLKSLDLNGLDLHIIDVKLFSLLSKLQFVHFKKHNYCGLVPKVPHCRPKKTEIFTSLLNGTILRICLWVIAFTVMFGNTFVLLSRWLSATDNLILDIFIKNLAGADFLMGLYLMIIGIKDIQYQDDFTLHSFDWSSSWGCTITGVIGMISAEVSLLVLTVMSLDRYLVIGSPYSNKKLSKNWAMASMLLVWIFVLFLSWMPILVWKTAYFGGSHLCFTMHLHDPFSIGWEYSAFVFIGLNSICLVCIAIFYGRLFWVVRQTSSSTPLVSKDAEMTIRFFLMVLTDFICWVPVIVLKILAFQGNKIPRNFLPWISIFILPVNSAVNPMLYTFSTGIVRKRIFQSILTKSGTIRKRQRNMPESIEAKLMSPEITTDDSKLNSSHDWKGNSKNASRSSYLNSESVKHQDSITSNFSAD